MFGVDFSEIGLIFLIALVVLGPAKLPQLAATIGRWVGRARVMARQFREQLEQEANTLRDATDLKSRPPPPPRAAPASTPPVAAPAEAQVAEAQVADPAPATESAAPSALVTDSLTPEPAASAESIEIAPVHPDHPAPPPAEPHERGA